MVDISDFIKIFPHSDTCIRIVLYQLELYRHFSFFFFSFLEGHLPSPSSLPHNKGIFVGGCLSFRHHVFPGCNSVVITALITNDLIR